MDFVNRTKMEYACHLLEEKKMMVMEIAYRLGIENAYYFSKVFRKYIGKYRQPTIRSVQRRKKYKK